MASTPNMLFAMGEVANVEHSSHEQHHATPGDKQRTPACTTLCDEPLYQQHLPNLVPQEPSSPFSQGLSTSLIQETPFGQLLRWISKKKWLKYRDEEANALEQVPRRLLPGYKASLQAAFSVHHEDKSQLSYPTGAHPAGIISQVEAPPTVEGDDQDPYLVDWFGPSDSDNPQNWSCLLKIWITVAISVFTFSVYVGAGIYSSAEELMAEFFGVSLEAVIVGLTIFIIGYGIGPMLGMTSASEVSWIGRNPPYIITLFLFVVLQIPTALVDNYAGMIVLRFLAGFFGGPVLATGGASLGDVWPPTRVVLSIGVWSVGAVMGPTAGPLIGGFASQSLGWRWSIWPLLILSAVMLVVIFFALPETFAENILLRRAQRLRKLTGNPHLRARCELKPKLSFREEAYETLVRPLLLAATQPIVIGINMHVALVYAVMYVFLESLPLVYTVAQPEGYGFSTGELGIVFFCLNIGCWTAFSILCIWHERVFVPTYLSHQKKGRAVPTEIWLQLSMAGGCALPAVLFYFAWTASPAIHWIVPTIAYVVLSPPIYLIMQCSFGYLAQAYPEWVASTFAANDAFRSLIGSALPLVSRQLFRNMHKWYGPRHFPVAWGMTVLAFIALAMAPIPILLHRFGPKLRQLSSYADTRDLAE